MDAETQEICVCGRPVNGHPPTALSSVRGRPHHFTLTPPFDVFDGWPLDYFAFCDTTQRCVTKRFWYLFTDGSYYPFLYQ